jgi:hypothetical protein
MDVRTVLLGRFNSSYSHSRRVQMIAAAILTPNRRGTVRRAAPWLTPFAIVLSVIISAAPRLSAQAPQSSPTQVGTFSFHPSSSGTITVTLPQIIHQHATIIVGVTFSPADITGVTIGEVGGGAGDVESLNRGLPTSIFHNGPGGPFYTNFYYGPNHGNQLGGVGAGTVTLNFSGGATYALIAVAEVSGLACLDCQELDQSAYNESLSPTASWSSGSATTTAFNEYLFSWGATEASDSSCSSPGNGWTLESQTNDPSGAAVCLLDQFVTAPGLSYQASVKASPAANYGMELVTFAKQIPTLGQPAVTSVNPSFGAQGQSLPTVVIAGSGFDSKTVCSFGAGITVNSCTPNSATQMVAKIAIVSTAGVGPRNVTVTSVPDSNAGTTLANAFSVTPYAATPDFTIGAAPSVQTVFPGGAAKFTLTLKASGGFNSAVNLGCGPLPSGAACAFNPLSITPSGTGVQSTLTVTTPSTLAAGNFPVPITATSGTVSHTQDVQVAVAFGGITGSVSPTSATIAVGSSANFAVSVVSTGGFSGQVSLVCSGAPSGVGCALNPGVINLPANGSANSTLSVQVAFKPSISRSERQPANRPLFPSRNLPLMGLALALLAAALFSFGVILRRRIPGAEESLFRASGITFSSRSCLAGLAPFALVLVLAVGLTSCGGTTSRGSSSGGAATSTTGGTGGSGSSGGTSGGSGGGTTGSVTTQVTVQAQSAGATTNLGTISITVP